MKAPAPLRHREVFLCFPCTKTGTAVRQTACSCGLCASSKPPRAFMDDGAAGCRHLATAARYLIGHSEKSEKQNESDIICSPDLL